MHWQPGTGSKQPTASHVLDMHMHEYVVHAHGCTMGALHAIQLFEMGERPAAMSTGVFVNMGSAWVGTCGLGKSRALQVGAGDLLLCVSMLCEDLNGNWPHARDKDGDTHIG